MRTHRSLALGLAWTIALVVALTFAGSAIAAGAPLRAELTGANEPAGGDPDGSGSFAATFNPGTGQVCYTFEVTGVDPLFASHIHVAPAGVAGPIEIPLPPSTATGGSGCVTADRDLILAIIRDPSAYYFNVHNATYPAGALRGQLTR